MTDSTYPSAEGLAQLHARAQAPTAVAADWLAYGKALLAQAGRDTPNGHTMRDTPCLRDALSALVRAWRLDASSDPALLPTIAQTAFIVRDWPLVESATELLLARDPADANALVWRAAAVQQRDDFDESQRLLLEAARVAPNNPVVLHKLALCIKEQARFAQAEALLRRVLELSPDSPHALFDLAELEIRAGRFAQGWPHYEARVAFDDGTDNAQQALAAISPHWHGESLAGKTLVVYGEQGHGDCLWAVRFLPRIAQRAREQGGRVIFGHDGPLRSLFERMLPADVTLETSLDTHPDFHCGLMSLPLHLGIHDASGWAQPYLSAEPARIDAWREYVVAAATNGQRRVGLVWNGNPAHIRDTRRSVPVEQLEPLLLVPGITWFALSPGRAATVAQWRAHGIDIVDPTARFAAGFDDVAALLMHLDLVVTIDSGPAHLAGALGVPTCLMIDRVSAWFWGEETQTTPWYRSIELVRQPSVGAWAPVIEQVKARVEALAATRGE
ncbi:glycosyltransferase family 9 protein [Paraburkholderia rhizosphaerae]|uniref:Tetratricopeptide repeat protein n=1 Tax=Paraburkholderia rhizosphaerae TaxID=480658 RepID=A0A4R8LDT0_9BURK|nr:glycosyltransferase family 9 protein [Paraburkholderia rhizosphaerae]TDY40289.1 tetratricopeptide repeat protein [Paraburkholderia rhizosphaerae]